MAARFIRGGAERQLRAIHTAVHNGGHYAGVQANLYSIPLALRWGAQTTVFAPAVFSTGINWQRQHRAIHNTSQHWSITTREELVELITGGSDIRLIDVREPHEYADGFVPTAVNIPLGNIEEAFALTEEDWRLLWGIDKPTQDELVIVYCRSGVRSESARCVAPWFAPVFSP
jgi:rhodanese-related sulfurtransferase